MHARVRALARTHPHPHAPTLTPTPHTYPPPTHTHSTPRYNSQLPNAGSVIIFYRNGKGYAVQPATYDTVSPILLLLLLLLLKSPCLAAPL